MGKMTLFIEVPVYCSIEKVATKWWINVATIRNFRAWHEDNTKTYLGLSEECYEVIDMPVQKFVELLNKYGCAE